MIQEPLVALGGEIHHWDIIHSNSFWARNKKCRECRDSKQNVPCESCGVCGSGRAVPALQPLFASMVSVGSLKTLRGAVPWVQPSTEPGVR